MNHFQNDPVAEAEIRELIAKWTDALHRKDADDLLEDYSETVELFDVGTQLSNREEYKELWKQCFPYFEESIDVERKNLTIHVSGDMAIVHCFSRLTGMKDPSVDMAKTWFRMTVCIRKLDGKWKVIHEHYSLPIDCMTEKPLYLLDEDQENRS